MPQACSAYKLDLNGAQFGNCTCGFPKSAHSSAALSSRAAPATSGGGKAGGGGKGVLGMAARFNQAPAAEPPVPRPAARQWKPPPKPTLATYDYPAEVRHPRGGLAHQNTGALLIEQLQASVEEAVNTAGGHTAPSAAPLVAPPTPQPKRQPPAAEPSPPSAPVLLCELYKLDVTAARFGDCVCGQPKAAHSSSALASVSAAAPKKSAGGKMGDLGAKLGGVFNPAMLQPGGAPKRRADDARDRAASGMGDSTRDDDDDEPWNHPRFDRVQLPGMLPAVPRAPPPPVEPAEPAVLSRAAAPARRGPRTKK